MNFAASVVCPCPTLVVAALEVEHQEVGKVDESCMHDTITDCKLMQR